MTSRSRVSHTAVTLNTDRYVKRMRDLQEENTKAARECERLRRHVVLAWVIASVSNAITMAVLILDAFK